MKYKAILALVLLFAAAAGVAAVPDQPFMRAHEPTC